MGVVAGSVAVASLGVAGAGSVVVVESDATSWNEKYYSYIRILVLIKYQMHSTIEQRFKVTQYDAEKMYKAIDMRLINLHLLVM